MARARVSAVIVLTVMVGAAGGACSSSSSSPSKPPLCSSLDALKASVHTLGNTDIRANGVSQLRTDLEKVVTDANAVVSDAKDQYAPQVARIKADVTGLKTAAAAAQANPSAATLGAVGTAIKAI